MSRWCHGFVIVALWSLALGSLAEAQTVYDDFSGPLLDVQRWAPNIVGQNNVAEMRRELVNGELLEYMVVNGGNRADIGAAFGRHELRFTSVEFSALVFEATVFIAAVTGCPTPGAQVSAVFVDAPLTLFNDGSATSPTDQTGDVQARLEIFRASDSVDPPEILQVIGQLTRCADAACGVRDFLGTASLGTVALGIKHSYGVHWDAFRKAVGFWKDAEVPQYLPYAQVPAFNRSYRALGLSAAIANCTVAPRPIGLVMATVDNVVVFP
jgi:hypothetical protein